MKQMLACLIALGLLLPSLSLAGEWQDSERGEGMEDFDENRAERTHDVPLYKQEGDTDWVSSRDGWTRDRANRLEDKYEDVDQGRRDFEEEREQGEWD